LKRLQDEKLNKVILKLADAKVVLWSIQEVCSNKEDKKNTENLSSVGRKRGRVKLKKLPLSICTSKDRAQPMEGVRARSAPLTEMNTGGNHHPVGNIPLFPMEPSTERVIPIEATTTCKCQEFKAPACIKQNKAVQS